MTSFIYPEGKRVLQIAHNHPDFSPGGTELVALSLHREALRRGVDSWFLGAAEKLHIPPNLGTQMMAMTPDHREAAIFAHVFKRFEFSQYDTNGFLLELQTYIAELKPDIVHIHHMLNFGLESLFIIREMLTQAEIYITLHDYYAICANNGQLYKHDVRERCEGPTIRECLKCFPGRTPNDFAMRRLAFENALALCDKIISPSHFLKERVEKNLRLNRPIEVIENFNAASAHEPVKFKNSHPGQYQFGYMGNISSVKGLSDLLEACDILKQRGKIDFRLHVFGSQLYDDEALANRIADSKDRLGNRIKYYGRYTPADVPALVAHFECLVFPSVWWENAPLVIYEALYHGRAIVAYPHGGAAEILNRRNTGVLAAASDPEALALAMERAATAQGNSETSV